MTVRSFLFCIRGKDLAAKCLSSAEELRYTYNKMNLEPCQKKFFLFCNKCWEPAVYKVSQKKTNIRLEKEGQYYVE